jgi:RNA polymerase sigma-70 factor (ECF subfamily)
MDKSKQDSDTFSIEALKNGSREELARFVDDFSPKIYSMALRMLGDSQDAEDVLQETFIKAITHLKEFEGRSSLSTWLYRIATNEALMIIRKRKPTLNIGMDDANEEGEEGVEPVRILDWCCLPEKELLSAEAHSHLNEAVQRLSPALRMVFTLRDIQGLSIRDTSSILNISEEAVKTRLLRARLKLREDLSDYYGERFAEMEKE